MSTYAGHRRHRRLVTRLADNWTYGKTWAYPDAVYFAEGTPLLTMLLFTVVAWEAIGLVVMTVIRVFGIPNFSHRHSLPIHRRRTDYDYWLLQGKRYYGWDHRYCPNTCTQDWLIGHEPIELWGWLIGGFFWPVMALVSAGYLIVGSLAWLWRAIATAALFVTNGFVLLADAIIFVLRIKI